MPTTCIQHPSPAATQVQSLFSASQACPCLRAFALAVLLSAQLSPTGYATLVLTFPFCLCLTAFPSHLIYPGALEPLPPCVSPHFLPLMDSIITVPLCPIFLSHLPSPLDQERCMGPSVLLTYPPH